MRKTSAWDVPQKDNIEVAALDVTSQESVDNLVAEIIKKEGNYAYLRCVRNSNAPLLVVLVLTFKYFAGKIDILVNNAGFGLGGYIESVAVDEAKVSKIFNLDSQSKIRDFTNS
jgi:NAD(P)-dependent dehydrogenase (short-subunit alcohol dehydrogenase family)